MCELSLQCLHNSGRLPEKWILCQSVQLQIHAVFLQIKYGLVQYDIVLNRKVIAGWM